MTFKTYIRLLFLGWAIVAIIALPLRLVAMVIFYLLAQPYFLVMFRSCEEWYRFKHEIREEIDDTKKLRDWQIECIRKGGCDEVPNFNDDDYYDGKLFCEK